MKLIVDLCLAFCTIFQLVISLYPLLCLTFQFLLPSKPFTLHLNKFILYVGTTLHCPFISSWTSGCFNVLTTGDMAVMDMDEHQGF